MNRSIPPVLMLLLALSLPLVAQQTVTLRFIDYQTGKPIPKARVTATWWNGTIPSTGFVTRDMQTIVAKVSTRTGGDGTIQLPLPAPVPEHLEIASPFDTVDGLNTQLNVGQILESGAMVIADADNSPDATLWQGRQVAGEVVIFTRKVTARDRTP